MAGMKTVKLDVISILLGCWLQALICLVISGAEASITSGRPSKISMNQAFDIIRDDMIREDLKRETAGFRGTLVQLDWEESQQKNGVEITDLTRTRKDVEQTAVREQYIYQRLTSTLALESTPRIGRKALGDVSSNLNERFSENNPIKLRSEDVREMNSRAAGYESTVSLTGGGYSMTITIGTPPRKFTAFADTGSDLPWIQCSPCESCFMQDEQFFDPAMSSSYGTVSCSSMVCLRLEHEQNFAGCKPRCGSSGTCAPTCQYEYEYGDQTHSIGDMATESLTLSNADGEGGKLVVPKFIFGCGHQNSGSLNQTSASGIIGLGRGELSLINQLKPYMSAKFSTCLQHRTTAVSKTSSILFGQVAETTASSLFGMQYTSIVSGNNSVESFYYVNVEGISVGNHRIVVPDNHEVFSIDSTSGQGGTILDSGSTLTSLVPHLYELVIEEFVKQGPTYPRVDFSSHGLDLCFGVTGLKNKPIQQLPSLTFHLTGADWTMPHENMGFEVSDGEGGMVICVALTKSIYGTNIIGNYQQQNFHILYDLEKEQIGFAKTLCDDL